MEREIKELGQKEANEMSKRADALENALKAAEKNHTAAKQLSWKMAKEAYEKAAFNDIQDMNTNTEGGQHLGNRRCSLQAGPGACEHAIRAQVSASIAG